MTLRLRLPKLGDPGTSGGEVGGGGDQVYGRGVGTSIDEEYVGRPVPSRCAYPIHGNLHFSAGLLEAAYQMTKTGMLRTPAQWLGLDGFGHILVYGDEFRPSGVHPGGSDISVGLGQSVIERCRIEIV